METMHCQIPRRQTAIQLTGPDTLVLNSRKPVSAPGPYQILCRVEAVGLCFSDLKLLKQFSSHARKGGIISGIGPDILNEVPSYVPGNTPTVPGHEAVVRICAVGEKVTTIKQGQRYLVQTDYRWLPTAASNAAFGYNFEGALQEYVLMDQRIITSPDGQSMLIAASEKLSASAIALVEPWACVEEAYAAKERTAIKTDGHMLVVADQDIDAKQFIAFLGRFGRPRRIMWVSKSSAPHGMDVIIEKATDVSQLPQADFKDVIYFGCNVDTVESLFPKIAPQGLFNIVLCGCRFSKEVSAQIGRIHYGNIRLTGTTGSDPAESMKHIPLSGEIRKGDKINLIGAAGPMGVMHVVRNICQGADAIFAGDIDEGRLAVLSKIAKGLAEKNGVSFKTYNPTKDKVDDVFDYVVLMAPIAKLIADSVKNAANGGIINIFAGIPANVTAPIDLDNYIEKKLYFIGTSGSTLTDMKTVLAKVQSGQLDTNVSVGAVCGLAGAVEGIRAVENHLISGKIVVYPACKDLPLLTLDKLEKYMPDVAESLDNGLWCDKAERTLLELY